MTGGLRCVGRLAAGAMALWLAGCAADKPKPTPLQPLTPQLTVEQIWSTRIGRVTLPANVPLRDGAVMLVDVDGGMASLDAQSGRELWRGSAGARVSAGVGSDGRFAAVVTDDNTLVVLERGERKWTARLDSATVASPFVAGERVFVLGVDRGVHAFDALDGRRLWSYQRAGEALTLATPGVLGSYKDTLIVGQGAVLVGLDPTTGRVRWEVAITSPRGSNEVERLNELVGPPLRLGDLICARAFQTAVGCVAADNATLRWSRLAPGKQAVGGDVDLVFGADASDRITAWRTANGETAWTNETLLYRGLSAPLSLGRSVVFVDAEGWVHFLDRRSGEALARLPTDGSAAAAPPLRIGEAVLVVTRNGGVFAFKSR